MCRLRISVILVEVVYTSVLTRAIDNSTFARNSRKAVWTGKKEREPCTAEGCSASTEISIVSLAQAWRHTITMLEVIASPVPMQYHALIRRLNVGSKDMFRKVASGKQQITSFFKLACLALLCLTIPVSSADADSPVGERDPYGGWNKVRFESTGFFYVSMRDGIWWLVTPEGTAFISKGVNHVSFRADHAPKLGNSPYQRAVQAKYGSENAWAEAVINRLRDWGFNTLGSWSSPSTFRYHMPYTVNLNLATRVGADWLKGAVGDFFAEDFEQKMEATCQQLCGPRSSDPWLLGYFTDNELRWGADWRGKQSLLEEYLRFPREAAGRKAALSFLKQRYTDIAAFNQAWGTNITRWDELNGSKETRIDAIRKDQVAWQEVVAERYFSTCQKAIRKADPNHLILGCRFAGRAPAPVLHGLRDYVDMVSFNNCGQTAPVETLQEIHHLTGRPIMLTEFSFKAMDSGLPNTRGAGRPVPTQKDRAEGFTRYVHGLIDLPFMVGFHWFEHTDEPKEGRFDGENSNYGLVTIEDRPWDLLTRSMKQVNLGLDVRHVESIQR
jgi:hypothetical protein